MTLFALALFAGPAFAGGGGGVVGVDPDDEPYELIDGQCWTCEIELYVYGCSGPAITQNLTFEAEAASAQACADELYDEVQTYMVASETCIQDIWNADFVPFVLTQGSINGGVTLMEFDSDQDFLECDSSTWLPIIEANPTKFRP